MSDFLCRHTIVNALGDLFDDQVKVDVFLVEAIHVLLEVLDEGRVVKGLFGSVKLGNHASSGLECDALAVLKLHGLLV